MTTRNQNFSRSFNSSPSAQNSKSKKTQNPFILLPLYIYPTTLSWDPLYATLIAHPSLQVTIVINPNNGPGPAPLPNIDYKTAITTLRGFQNVKLLGYVYVSYGKRAAGDVKADMDIYMGWSKREGERLRMDGFFFDEAPSEGDGSSAGFAYMQDVCQYARDCFSNPIENEKITSVGKGLLVFNPGVVVHQAYYTISDYIISFENFYHVYQDVTSAVRRGEGENLGVLRLGRSDVGVIEERLRRERSCILIHHFNGTFEELGQVVKGVAAEGVGGLWVGCGEYDGWGRSGFWGEFCRCVDGVGVSDGCGSGRR